jgi:N-acetylglucosamine kinase-like BadF-type ATPase
MSDALTEVRDGILIITINRPDAKNAMNKAASEAIAAALDQLDADNDLRVGIVTGAGGTFCSGMDLKGFLRGETPFVAGRGFGGITQKSPAKPLIAAVDGYALAGGLDGEAGLALISGTGSSCLGRDPKGDYFNCGGWAWFMDDGGSGFGLSHDALRTAVRMVDGRETPTSLLPAVLDFYEVPDQDCLLERLYNRKWTPAEIASFAPAIMKLAADGDPAAMGVLRRGAVALAELVSTTAANLEFSQPPRVVLLGGCVRSGAPYQPMVESEIRNSCPGVRLCEPLHDTIYGAALNALFLASSKNLIPPAVRPRFPKK